MIDEMTLIQKRIMASQLLHLADKDKDIRIALASIIRANQDVLEGISYPDTEPIDSEDSL